jgi:hypothetical protein
MVGTLLYINRYNYLMKLDIRNFRTRRAGNYSAGTASTAEISFYVVLLLF